MTKEELIELLNTVNFEEVRCMTLSYYKKKPNKYNYSDEDCASKTICIGTDLEKLIKENEEYSRLRCNEIYREVEKLKNEVTNANTTN